MNRWSSRAFKKHNSDKPVAVVETAALYGRKIQTSCPELPVIFTLNHLALKSGVPYNNLRSFVDRTIERPYRSFTLRKNGRRSNPRKFRVIKVPQQDLKKAQQFINQNILSKMEPHECSVAFSPGSKIYDAASEHCNARWLLKFDIVSFFESITEKSVYRVFRRYNYPALLSFEMARICTALKAKPPVNWGGAPASIRYPTIPGYSNNKLGTLPQGAPTSPMLANLVSYNLDRRLKRIADAHSCHYSRYADDITFSTDSSISRGKVSTIIAMVNSVLREYGHTMNKAKTTIAPPGARKFYLGMNICGDVPQLRKSFKRKLKQHLFFCEKGSVGPEKHSEHLGFVSVIGFKNHLRGLINYACQVDSDFGKLCMQRFQSIDWPL